MSLTETQLRSDASATLIETSPLDYDFSFPTRSDKRGGGSVTILRAGLSFKYITFGQYIFLNTMLLFVTVLPFYI